MEASTTASSNAPHNIEESSTVGTNHSSQDSASDITEYSPEVEYATGTAEITDEASTIGITQDPIADDTTPIIQKTTKVMSSNAVKTKSVISSSTEQAQTDVELIINNDSSSIKNDAGTATYTSSVNHGFNSTTNTTVLQPTASLNDSMDTVTVTFPADANARNDTDITSISIIRRIYHFEPQVHEATGSAIIGVMSILFIVAIFGVVFFLDFPTIGKHIKMLKRNLGIDEA